MKTKSFIELVSVITGRKLNINTDAESLELDSEYIIYKVLPTTGYRTSFKFKTPKKEETILKSFITQFTSKYLEPNPKYYDGKYPGSTAWKDMTEKEREFCYLHHRSNMFSKNHLKEQIMENMKSKEVDNAFSRYGFYETHYGIGLFVIYNRYSGEAVSKMKQFLKSEDIPYTNEFSDARWVFRFVLNIDKNIHRNIIEKFNQQLKK